MWGLETCPSEVLERIVLTLIYDTFLGPPTDLLSILRVSRTVYSRLSITNNPWLYSQIFKFKFDHRAVLRRLDTHEGHAKMFSGCLVKRFTSLKRFRHTASCREFVAEPTALDDLWTVYTMFLENDHCNASQLIHYAKVDRFAFDFISHGGPFHDGTEDNGGWKVDNEMNALAAWLFWFTDKDRVARETAAARQRILEAVAHVFVGSFKYASAHAPITTFHIPPIPMPPESRHTRALPISALPVSHATIKNIFNQDMMVTQPLLTPAALLICVVRLEAAAVETPLHLPVHVPANQAEAVELHWNGPTVEDYEQQMRPTTKFEEWGMGQASERHEHDWLRLRTCFNPWSQPMIPRRVFTPGMLDGTWVGRAFSIPPDQFITMMNPDLHLGLPDDSSRLHVYPRPLQFSLREHHRRNSHLTSFTDICHNPHERGVFQAWLPEGTVIAEAPGQLVVNTPNMTPSIYQTYNAVAAAERVLDKEFSKVNDSGGRYGQEVCDILLTARTDGAFGHIWGHQQYYGRVRIWDGLVVLVNVPAEYQSSIIFYGYVQGNQNLIGRWRETDTPVDVPGWEGVWSMTKIHQ